jgi:hypothetical protein
LYPRREKVHQKTKKEMVGYVENDLKEMGVTGWRKIARDTEAWKLIHIVALGPAWAIEPLEM